MSKELSRDVEIKGYELSVSFNYDNASVSNDGIGHYEFWGAKCFDKGHDYVEEFDIIDLTVYSERLNKYVKPSDRLKKVMLDKLYSDDSISEEIMEDMKDAREAEQDYYDDMRYEEMREREYDRDY